jgi:hypothetical protein
MKISPRKYSLLILFLFIGLAGFAQTKDFKKEVGENTFKSLRAKHIPKDVLKALGYSQSEVGTRMTQTGCTSGKRIVINWMVSDTTGIYVLKTASCGRSTSTTY